MVLMIFWHIKNPIPIRVRVEQIIPTKVFDNPGTLMFTMQSPALIQNFAIQSLTLSNMPPLGQYGLWSFQTGGTKLVRFLPKSQHTQNIFLNFENWTNGEPQ